MNDAQFEDLKQFIDTRISQSEATTKEMLEKVRKEMNEGFAGIAEAMDEVNKQVDDRLAKLEQSST